MMKVYRFPAVLLAAALSLSPELSFAAAPQVSIDHHMFMPGTRVIHRGDSVVWINKDSDAHSIVSDDRGKTFRSAILDPGQSFALTFTKAGTFGYYCGVHPDMQATVVVK